MEHRARSRYTSCGAVVALSLLAAASPALAQVTPPAPSAPGGGLTALPPMERSTAGIVEGSVKKIDPSSQTVQIPTGLFGILGRTLGVTQQTQIQVEGRPGAISDLEEGKKVRAAYEGRDGKNVATLIEVMPAEDAADASAGAGPGARPPAPAGGMPSYPSQPPGTKQ
jgi:hypothetical protein